MSVSPPREELPDIKITSSPALPPSSSSHDRQPSREDDRDSDFSHSHSGHKRRRDDLDALPPSYDDDHSDSHSHSLELHKVVVRNLPFEAQEEEIRAMFASCGDILDLFFPVFEDSGRAKGFAFISFATRDGFDAACGFSGKYYGNRAMIVEKARPRPVRGSHHRSSFGGGGFRGRFGGGFRGGPPGGRSTTYTGQTRQIFVGNLADEVTRDRLDELFSPCGQILDIRMPKWWDSGRPKGFAFIEFEMPESVEEALKLNEVVLEGNPMRVNEEVRRRRGGGDGGGFHGGGGGFRERRGGGGGGYDDGYDRSRGDDYRGGYHGDGHGSYGHERDRHPPPPPYSRHGGGSRYYGGSVSRSRSSEIVRAPEPLPHRLPLPPPHPGTVGMSAGAGGGVTYGDVYDDGRRSSERDQYAPPPLTSTSTYGYGGGGRRERERGGGGMREREREREGGSPPRFHKYYDERY